MLIATSSGRSTWKTPSTNLHSHSWRIRSCCAPWRISSGNSRWNLPSPIKTSSGCGMILSMSSGTRPSGWRRSKALCKQNFTSFISWSGLRSWRNNNRGVRKVPPWSLRMKSVLMSPTGRKTKDQRWKTPKRSFFRSRLIQYRVWWRGKVVNLRLLQACTSQIRCIFLVHWYMVHPRLLHRYMLVRASAAFRQG